MRSFFRSRWVRYPLVLVALLVLGGAVFLSYRLGTTHPAMYDRLGVVRGMPCSAGEENSEILVYTSLRPGNWDVFLFDTPGVEARALTDHPAMDYNAVLSSDGRWAVFVSERSGDAHLYALDLAAEGDPIALTTYPAMHDAPTLSPDGARLAFVSTRDGSADIWTMPFAPGDPDAEARAVNLTSSPHGDFNPVFSPDGSRIAFSSNRGLFRRWNPVRLVPGAEMAVDIYVMDADGSNLRRVIRALAISGSPAWTEDGDAILFHRARGPWDMGVYRSEIGSRRAVRLTPDTMRAVTPTAGPDGEVIFVAMDQSAVRNDQPAIPPRGGRLYRMAADGSGLTPLTEPGRNYLRPNYDFHMGRLVSHGDGPVPDDVQMANGKPFAWPGTTRTIQLPDRCLRVQAMRSYFPSVPGSVDEVVAVQWVHEAQGSPRGPSAIVSADPDGREVTPILSPADDGFMWTPVVTRDGEWIFFTKGGRFAPADEKVDIWKVRRDGTDAVNLTADSDANDAFPDVSADGEWVVFRSSRDGVDGGYEDGVMEIYIMNRNGDQVRRVTHAEGYSTMPTISPDGSWVAYSTNRAGKGMNLWIQSLVDSDDEGRLLEPERAHLNGLDMHPRFSPDGRWIVFTSDRAGFTDEWISSGMFPRPFGELYAIPVDGSHPAVRLTDDKWEDGLAFWGNTPAGED